LTLNRHSLEVGDVAFGNKTWAGPLFQIAGTNVKCKFTTCISQQLYLMLLAHSVNGNGHTFNGNGPFYWDGLGGNGGVTKPHPMMKCAF
jgi:polygalacturonase